MNKLGFILLVLFLSGCSVVSHLDEISTLSQYSNEKALQGKQVQETDAHYDALVAAITSGDIKKYTDEDSIRKDFGEPLITSTVQMNGQTQQQWTYRYAIQSKAKDRVYIYFDTAGKLLNYQQEKVEW